MDRKGWIILTISGILLAANLYFSEPQKKTEPTQDSVEKTTTEETSSASQSTAEPKPAAEPAQEPGLVNEPSIEPVGEDLKMLTSTKDGKDVAIFTFSSRGGGIKTVELLDQKAVGSETKHVIINADGPAPIGTLATAVDEFLTPNSPLVVKADENAVYSEAKMPNGLVVTRRWALEEDPAQPGAPWSVKLTMTLKNAGKSPIDLATYSLFTGAASPLHPREWENQGGAFFLDDGSLTSKDSNWFKKGMFRGARPLFQESVEDLEYAGVSNQFFTTLVRPSKKYPSSIWAKTSKITLPGGKANRPKYAIRSGFTLPDQKLEPGESTTLSYDFYVGPKHYRTLKKMKEGTAEVMNYGLFTPVSVTLSTVLNFLHDAIFSKIANKWAWGFSIIALTILIRITIWPLHNKSTRTMKRMSKLQPIMKELREKYKDDPTKLNQETMKLYKEYQINPMGGCLPMLVQIPIFFGYYRMLQYAVELRGQEFLWVKDLSMPDTIATLHLPFELPMLGSQIPINLLPILMAVTMVIQMKMTPKTGDQTQQRIMMFMPLMFFFFCYNFASALALYWTTQNIFSIGQTWLANRLPEPELKKRTKPGKPGKKSFMERMAERAEAMQKQQNGGATAKPMRNATPKKKRKPKTGG